MRTLGVMLLVAGVLAGSAAEGQETPCAAPECGRAPAAAEAPAAWRASLEYGYVHFASGAAGLDPWHAVTAEVSRKAAPATVVARGTWARRFGEDGFQVEADAYPRITPRIYAYLNAGYSPSEIFPELRLGGELYGNAGGGWEVSAGARRLEFAETGVTIYTGSVGKYVGNYYLSARPYVTPKDEGTSVSAAVLARRYFESADSYATAVVGWGTAPSESPLEFELRRASTLRAGVYGKTPLRGALGLRWSFGYEHEELTVTQDRDRYSFGIGVESRL